ncbi:MAG: HAD-IIIA family hydrolase [Candidatus Omnitrophota bacterium]
MRAIFLDRDGVINRYPGDKKYVTSWESFKFLPKAKRALARLSRANFKIFVISNQAGVGKGIFSQRTLNSITRRMLAKIEDGAGRIDAVYYCTHKKNDHCSCRKPKAGLLYKARKDFPGIEFKKSFFIGDTIRDILAAKAAGCKSVLVLSGKEKISNRLNWLLQPDFIFPGLWGAVQFIIKK